MCVSLEIMSSSLEPGDIHIIGRNTVSNCY